jgi:hypothetical protein
MQSSNFLQSLSFNTRSPSDHLNACPNPEECIGNAGIVHPCGCPDCNKPHPPHFAHDYCLDQDPKPTATVDIDSVTVSATNTTAYNYSSQATLESQASTYAPDSTINSDKSLSSPLIYVIGGAALAALLAGLAIRKAVCRLFCSLTSTDSLLIRSFSYFMQIAPDTTTTTVCTAQQQHSGVSGNIFTRMGMLLGIAGTAGAVGAARDEKGRQSLIGSVARRVDAIERDVEGSDIPVYVAESPRPRFIHPKDFNPPRDYPVAESAESGPALTFPYTRCE